MNLLQVLIIGRFLKYRNSSMYRYKMNLNPENTSPAASTFIIITVIESALFLFIVTRIITLFLQDNPF